MTLPSQQFCLRGILFNVHDTLMKHALRLALVAHYFVCSSYMVIIAFIASIQLRKTQAWIGEKK